MRFSLSATDRSTLRCALFGTVLGAAMALSRSTPARAVDSAPVLPKVAVLEFAGTLPPAALGDFTDVARAAAIKVLAGKYNVLTNESQEAVLKGQGIDLGKCSGDVCEVDIFKTMQAKYGVTGKVRVSDDEKIVTLTLYDVASGVALGSESARGKKVSEVEKNLEVATKVLLSE